MSNVIRVALVGDHKPAETAHVAIPQALKIAAAQTGYTVEHEWLATPDLASGANEQLKRFDALWGVPASPYENMDGALAAIRYARETRLPFLGTCGGYQHAVLEYARNVLGYREADNAEVNPQAAMPLIALLSCALVEKSGAITLAADSYIRALCEKTDVNEQYHCSYGVNPAYLSIFSSSDLVVSGVDPDGEPRAIELKGHPFYIGTAFQPERSALRNETHPLISAFIRAAAGRLALCA